jgi:hypothetical protein
MTDIASVIGWKFSHQAGMETKDGVITAFPGGIPSKSNQDAWTAEYEAHVAATAYQEKRRDAYAELADQLDMLFHDMTAGKADKDGNWYAAIAKVKSDNPKPE